jgi:hypothetical protein
MAEDGFPLPGSSYKELSKIIAGYSETAGPSAPADVSKLVGVHDTQVSRSNKFLLAIGLIEGGQKKSCTALGLKLGRAIHFNQVEEVASCWKTVFGNTDFLQKIVSSIRIRRGMEESALASHIAFTSGNAKSGNSMAGAGAIIEILRIAEAVKTDGGTLLAADIQAGQEKSDDQSLGALIHVPKPRENDPHKVSDIQTDQTSTTSSSFTHLAISLNISCTPKDLEGLGSKLRKLRQEFEGETEVEIKLSNDDEYAAEVESRWDTASPFDKSGNKESD